MIVTLTLLASRTRGLKEEEIRDIYKLLDLCSEERRQRVLSQLSFFQEIKDAPLRIRGGNTTTPYSDVNA